MLNVLAQINRFAGIDISEGEAFSLLLPAKVQHTEIDDNVDTDVSTNKMEVNGYYEIHVKQWMLEPSTPSFNFHEKWNNNIPMPMTIMQGRVLKETRGMYQMELTCQAKPRINCYCCGRKLTNTVSKLYGIGPECSAKIGLIRIESEEEAREKWDIIERQLSEIHWTGYIPKSAIKDWSDI